MEEEKVAALIKENRRFHMALISACPSVWQLRFISTLYDQSERFRRLSLINSSPTIKTVNTDDHQLIMDAAFQRQVDSACDLLYKHIEQSNKQVIETLFD